MTSAPSSVVRTRRAAHHPWRWVVLTTLVALLASGQVAASARTQRPMPVGSDPFTAGAAYHGDFPDPTVWRVGARYYAASTTVAGLNLPLMSSTDLRTWTARPRSNAADPWSQDALPTPPPWARKQQTASGHTFMATWAPSVARLADGSYVAAYSVPRASDGRRCVTLAHSTSPMGPFVDSSVAPLGCANGVIDPQVFVDGGRILLLYKLVGSWGRLMIRRLNSTATAWAAGSANYTVLKPSGGWEGGIIENPAMVRARGRLYLFYSGNEWTTSRYGTGYAVCRSIVGPCTKLGRILGTGTYLTGPGGATPFWDTRGRLRLAFHSWSAGNVGYPKTTACRSTAQGCAQRRMRIAYLVAGAGDRLRVHSWF
jgi:hypothetical protein